MSKVKSSIEKPEISQKAMSMFKYLFWGTLMDLEEAHGTITTFAQQAKIRRLRGNMQRFVYSRPYAFFRIVTLPENGVDPENADVSLEIKNFEYYIENLEPKRYVLVISNTWDTFIVFEETVDKNLIKHNYTCDK